MCVCMLVFIDCVGNLWGQCVCYWLSNSIYKKKHKPKWTNRQIRQLNCLTNKHRHYQGANQQDPHTNHHVVETQIKHANAMNTKNIRMSVIITSNVLKFLIFVGPLWNLFPHLLLNTSQNSRSNSLIELINHLHRAHIFSMKYANKSIAIILFTLTMATPRTGWCLRACMNRCPNCKQSILDAVLLFGGFMLRRQPASDLRAEQIEIKLLLDEM